MGLQTGPVQPFSHVLKRQGIPVDLPRAMAWIALAAERGEPRYVRVRDAINVTLDSEQVAEANRILDQLKPKYADKKAMRKAKRRWRDAKLDRTGSRLGFAGGVKVGGAGQTWAACQTINLQPLGPSLVASRTTLQLNTVNCRKAAGPTRKRIGNLQERQPWIPSSSRISTRTGFRPPRQQGTPGINKREHG